jgi:hypothetical protein
VYSAVTCKASEIFVEEITVSALAVDNFETRVVQQFSEFFTRIWWVLVCRYELMGILKRWKYEVNLLKTKLKWHYKHSVRASVININRWIPYNQNVAVCCENRTEHTNTVCGQNALSLCVKPAVCYCVCVFRVNQSNPRLLALQQTHRWFRYSDGLFTCFVDG